MLSDLLILLGIVLALFIGFVFIMVAVFYAMGEWHKDRHKSNQNQEQ